jgi:hypothetical protein
LNVAGVVFAVLVALGIDEAWKARENVELAREASDRLVEEVLANREDLAEAEEVNGRILSDVRLATRDSLEGDLGFDYEVAILSVAAWEAAGLTGAVRFMDFEDVARFSRLYKLQALYEAQQAAIVDVVAGMSTIPAGTPRAEVADRLYGPLAVAASLGGGLLAAYDSVLVRSGHATEAGS